MQCGVFKGSTKAVFVDRREYSDPLWLQVDNAVQYVLRNIHLGAKFVGIYRVSVNRTATCWRLPKTLS